MLTINRDVRLGIGALPFPEGFDPETAEGCEWLSSYLSAAASRSEAGEPSWYPPPIAVLEHVDGAVWMVDCDYRFVTGNIAFHNLLHEFYEKSTFDVCLLESDTLTAPDGRWTRLYNRAFSGERFAVEISYNSDSARRVFRFRFCATLDSAGRTSGTIVFGREITRRRTFPAAPAMHEDSLSRVFHGAPLLVTISSLEDESFLEVNNAFISATGYTREQAIGVSPVSLGMLGPVDMFRLHRSLRADGCVNEIELRLRCADDSELVCLYSANLVEICGRRRLLSIGVDITARKQAEQAHQATEALLRSYIEHAPDGVLVLNRYGILVDVNDAVCLATGFRRSDLVGRHFTALIPEDSHETAVIGFSKLRTTGSLHIEIPFAGENGARRYWSINGVQADDANYLAFARDVTSRYLATRELRARERRMSAQLDAVLSPEGDPGTLRLGDIMETKTIQAIIDALCKATGIGFGIVDTEGNILVAAGWQRICTEFHRVNHTTARNCSASDVSLATIGEPGTYKWRKCLNGMYDVVTPIVVGDRKLGSLLLGQFFLEDDPPDREEFKAKAAVCGFDEASYMEAFDAVPVIRRKSIEPVITFFVLFARYIARLSYSNLKLAQISERQRITQEQLGASENVKQVILDATNELVTYYDTQLRVIWANRGAAEVAGCSSDEMVGRHCYDIWNHRSEPCDECPIRSVIEYQNPIASELVNERGVVWDVRAYPVFNDSGVLTSIVEFAKDITDQKQEENERAELERQYRQAQKMEAIGHLTGGVAHDFNNLLQVINGYASMVLDDQELSESLRPSIEQISEAGDRAANLVSQLLLFSRRQILQPRSIDLNEVVEALLSMFSRIIGERIRVQWHPGEHLPPVLADRGMVEQAIMNICLNARDAMPSGGVLDIRTQAQSLTASDEASAAWAKSGNYVCVRIGDTGKGISPDIIDRIYEPFFSTKQPHEGSGLGLSTVYGIVEQHRGLISVTSECGVGTVFTLYWPTA